MNQYNASSLRLAENNLIFPSTAHKQSSFKNDEKIYFKSENTKKTTDQKSEFQDDEEHVKNLLKIIQQ